MRIKDLKKCIENVPDDYLVEYDKFSVNKLEVDVLEKKIILKT